jgi:hypothetical protein
VGVYLRPRGRCVWAEVLGLMGSGSEDPDWAADGLGEHHLQLSLPPVGCGGLNRQPSIFLEASMGCDMVAAQRTAWRVDEK